MKEWAETLLDEPILVTAAELVSKALSCGYGGCVILHGILRTTDHSNEKFEGRVLANLSPTYYGMMVALFKKD